MLDIIKSRRSVRQFEAGGVEKKDIITILEAGMYAPSAGNEQAWQFVVLEGEALAKYLKLNRNAPASAPIGVLVCMDRKAEKHTELNTAMMDCSAAVQNMLLEAHAKGLGAIWTAVFDSAKQGVRELLGLPAHVEPFAFVPVGRPKKKADAIPSRFDESKVHYGKWGARG